MAKKESTLYYFYSVGCGFCKKLDPIIDELNNHSFCHNSKVAVSESAPPRVGIKLLKSNYT